QAAEDEGQRLKGVLLAMDTVGRSLRGMGAQEHERLRQEHQRLEALQAAFAAEAEGWRHGCDDERRRLAERWARHEEERRGAMAELAEQRARAFAQEARLERERAAFAELQATATAATESAAAQQRRDDE
ncbi:unnamed protein product, partial [Phaeothamnion confervicola]